MKNPGQAHRGRPPPVPRRGNEAKRKQSNFCLLAYRELLGVRPRELGELLHGNCARRGRGAAGCLELAPVDEVGRLLAALGDDVLRREPGGGRTELRQRELGEHRDVPGGGAGRGRGRGRSLVRVQGEGRAVVRRWRRRRAVAGRLLRRVGPRPQRGAAATHQVKCERRAALRCGPFPSLCAGVLVCVCAWRVRRRQFL